MDNNDLTERDFEAYIEHWLTTEGGYVKGNQATYDKERAIDLKTLIKFLRLTQTKKRELYEKKWYKAQANPPSRKKKYASLFCSSLNFCVPLHNHKGFTCFVNSTRQAKILFTITEY